MTETARLTIWYKSAGLHWLSMVKTNLPTCSTWTPSFLQNAEHTQTGFCTNVHYLCIMFNEIRYFYLEREKIFSSAPVTVGEARGNEDVIQPTGAGDFGGSKGKRGCYPTHQCRWFVGSGGNYGVIQPTRAVDFGGSKWILGCYPNHRCWWL